MQMDRTMRSNYKSYYYSQSLLQSESSEGLSLQNARSLLKTQECTALCKRVLSTAALNKGRKGIRNADQALTVHGEHADLIVGSPSW